MISPTMNLLRGCTRARVALVRPGATSFDDQGRLKGSLNMPLSANGIDQANQLAAELSSLRLDAIYTAPCDSAMQTALRLAADRELKPKPIDAFRNLDQGLWHGKLVEEIRRNQPRLYRSIGDQPDSVCPPGGESVEQACARAHKAVRKILRRSHNRIVALVVPEPLASLMAAELKNEPRPKLWNVVTDRGEWQLIDAELC